MTNADQLDSHHRDTLTKIFRHPTSANIEWHDVESLLGAVGSVDTHPNGKLKVTIGSHTEVLEPPRGKDVDKQIVADLRRILTDAGYVPDDPAAS
jgi:hypothetical protein